MAKRFLISPSEKSQIPDKMEILCCHPSGDQRSLCRCLQGMEEPAEVEPAAAPWCVPGGVGAQAPLVNPAALAEEPQNKCDFQGNG